MSFEDAAKVAAKTISNNSPQILTGLAIVGTITTTVLAVKATPGVIDQIRAEERLANCAIPTKEKVAIAWKGYIPAAAMGTVTIACILGANSINTKRNVLLMGAYSLTEKAFVEYKNKVVETLGDKADLKVRESIGEDRVRERIIMPSEITITGRGETLFVESTTNTLFTGDLESVRKAVNDINFDINNEGYASLNDFYELLGLNSTQLGETLGWRSDNKLEISTVPVMSGDGRAAISIEYRNLPNVEYYRKF